MARFDPVTIPDGADEDLVSQESSDRFAPIVMPDEPSVPEAPVEQDRFAPVVMPEPVEDTTEDRFAPLVPAGDAPPSATDTFRSGLGLSRTDPNRPSPLFKAPEERRSAGQIAKDLAGTLPVGGALVPEGLGSSLSFAGEANIKAAEVAKELRKKHPIKTAIALATATAVSPSLGGAASVPLNFGKQAGKFLEFVGNANMAYWSKARKNTREQLVSEKGRKSTHPAWIISSGIAETTPQLIADFVTGKVAGKLAKGATSLATSAIEGNTAAAQQRITVRETINSMPQEDIEKLPMYGQALEAAGGNVAEARENLAKAASNRAYGLTFASTTLTSLALDKVGAGTLDKWLQDPKIAKIGMKKILSLAGMEATEEAIQSGFEKLIENKSTGRPTMEGVFEAMGYGAATGAILGGAIPGAGSLAQRADAKIASGQESAQEAVALPETQEEDIDDVVNEAESIPATPEEATLRSIENQIAAASEESVRLQKAEEASQPQDNPDGTPIQLGERNDIQAGQSQKVDPFATQGTKQRKFLARSEEAPGTPEEIVDSLKDVEPQDYEVHATSQELGVIRDWISEKPANKAEAEKRLFSDEPVSASKGVIGVALLEDARAAGDVAQETKLTEELDRQFREAGRFIQAASFWNKLSGKAWMATFDSIAEEKKIKVDPAVRENVQQRFAEAQQLTGQERTEALSEAITEAADALPLKFGEKLDSIRYANMLSNPRTHLRNTAFNTITTAFVRPLSLLGRGKVSGAGIYAKESGKAIKDAGARFMEVMRGGDETTSKEMEQYSKSSALEIARQKNAPKVSKWVGDFLNAQDQFFSTMISAGESARLIKEGVPEDRAVAEGNTLATRYLLRNNIGEDLKNKDINSFNRGLDGLGALMEKTRDLPVVGKPASWFIPFIRTPINWAKLGVQASPLGFTKKPKRSTNESDGAYQQRVEEWSDRQGMSRIGSGFVVMGAMLAAAGRTTWEPPNDKEERQAFYASGRKPYSILVGNKWVPMWYLGPYAFAVAIPAAFKDAWKDNPKLAGKNWASKMGGVAQGLAKFYTSQTPLQGFNTVLRLISGEDDFSLGKGLGFTAGQFIPGSGLIRYINSIVDPTFRKATNFFDSMKKDLPILSKQLEPHVDPDGNPAKRVASDYAMPFTLGTVNPEFDRMYQDRNSLLKDRGKNNEVLKDLHKRAKAGTISEAEIYTFIKSQPKLEASRLASKLRSIDKDMKDRLGLSSSSGRRKRRTRRKR